MNILFIANTYEQAKAWFMDVARNVPLTAVMSITDLTITFPDGKRFHFDYAHRDHPEALLALRGYPWRAIVEHAQFRDPVGWREYVSSRLR